ncbi:ABC transporter permease [Bacillus massilinigeriensis]|uniref:ABC transporter permease n=1 Tax=Bacillus massilionigeriensis TaxID=1805475 RepID=UPI00096B1372|nr:ABC transporter permease [Bacillus massilionigeriensis]
MLNLIRNELLKIFKRPGTYVMIGLLVMMLTVMGGIIKYQEGNGAAPDNQNWKQELQTQINSSQKELETMGDKIPESQLVYFKRDIAIKEYQIENNISPYTDYDVWEFVNDASNMIQFAGLFTIIVAAGIVASEFNWGTVKLLLIRPIARSRLLIAKYSTVLLFALMMLVILFAYSALLGFILFGSPEAAEPYLKYFDGKVTEQSMIFHLMNYYGLQSITMLMLSTMAFMISAVFRNSSLAIGLSIFLMFTGGQLTSLLASKFEWAKYILFANTDLMQYFEGMPMVEGMTLTFSIIMLVIYFILFQFLAHYVFKKRDVAA